MQNETITSSKSTKGHITPTFHLPSKVQFGQSSQLRIFQFKTLLLHMPSHERKKFLITFLRLHSTIANLKELSRWFPLLPIQISPSLSTEPLIKARKRVPNDLHYYLNPQNNSRYHYYPRRENWGLEMFGGKKNLPEETLIERGDSCGIQRNLLGLARGLLLWENCSRNPQTGNFTEKTISDTWSNYGFSLKLCASQ